MFGKPCPAEPHQAVRRVDSLIWSRHLCRTNLVCVSYLAQTRKPAHAIIYSPACVDGAATAESWLSFLRPLRISPDQVRAKRPHPANRHSSSCVCRELF